MNKKADTKTNLKYNKVAEAKRETGNSNIKYYLLLFVLVIVALLWNKIKKWLKIVSE
jgi:hypothetical protein